MHSLYTKAKAQRIDCKQQLQIKAMFVAFTLYSFIRKIVCYVHFHVSGMDSYVYLLGQNYTNKSDIFQLSSTIVS